MIVRGSIAHQGREPRLVERRKLRFQAADRLSIDYGRLIYDC